jgi:CheY-like chemotaxis protein
MEPVAVALPTLHTYGCVVLIDDSDDFVFTLKTLLASTDYRLVSFTEPAPLHAFVLDRAHLLVEEQALLSEIWRAQAGTVGTAALDALRFFARPHRFEVPLVLVTDYAMPLETGLSVCAPHRYVGFERVLLTGVADTNVAVAAFNAGLIEQFVRKQSQSVADEITSAVRGRLRASAERRSAQIVAALAPPFAAALAHADTAAALERLLADHDVREYMILGDPQGVVGITSGGQALWIQLETEASLDGLADLLALAEIAPEARQRVAKRQTLIAADFMQQVGLPATEAPAVALSRDTLLLAAIHRLSLSEELVPAVAGSGT